MLQLFFSSLPSAHARTKPTRQHHVSQCRAVMCIRRNQPDKRDEKSRPAPDLVIVHVPDTSALHQPVEVILVIISPHKKRVSRSRPPIGCGVKSAHDTSLTSSSSSMTLIRSLLISGQDVESGDYSLLAAVYVSVGLSTLASKCFHTFHR